MSPVKFLFFVAIISMSTSSAKALEAGLTTCVFHSSENSWVEIYTRILGGSAQFIYDNAGAELMKAEIEMLVVIKNQDIPVVVDKYNLESPLTPRPVDFWDARNYALKSGTYELFLQYVDLNNPRDTFRHTEILEIPDLTTRYGRSDVLFIADVSADLSGLGFRRSNFSFEPLAFRHAGAGVEEIYYYVEFYNTDSLSTWPCYLKYYVEPQQEIGYEVGKPGYRKFRKNHEALLVPLDVSLYPSGNYKLICEVYDRRNNLLDAFKKRFSVYHPLVDIKHQYEKDALFETSFVQLLSQEELDYGLKAVFPLAGNELSEMINLIVAGDDLVSKRYLLYNFWNAFAPDAPETGYSAFMEVARAVDREFGNNVGYGFETDRGYYFLKYGRPDDIVHVEDEPSAPPYEIWIYNYLPATQQTNVKFLFYNPSLAGNDFKLLHSTCRGELSNPNWEFDLYRDAFDNFDADGFNKNAKRYFTDF